MRGAAGRSRATIQNSPATSKPQAPSDAAFSGTELYIADAGNNRVIVMPVTPNSSMAVTQAVAHTRFNEGHMDIQATPFSGTVTPADAHIRVLNTTTGFAVEADARNGRFIVQGLEVGGPYVLLVRRVRQARHVS